MTLNPANSAFLDDLTSQLPADILTTPGPRHLEEPRGIWTGLAGALALPRTTEQVSTLVQRAAAHKVGIIPYGGGTGLVGGQVMQEGTPALLISLARMTSVRAVYPEENALIAEAGVTLADVQTAADGVGRLFPLSLASEGTASIGGNLATNAGGTAVLRYGNARDMCLGLEAVMPDGQIWHGTSRLRKDNTGYDLRHLMIGSEGTLGIITAASLKLWPKPADQGTALLTVPDPAAALKLLSLARDMVGDNVTAFELIHRQGFDFLKETLPEIRRPLDPAPEWCVLIELGVAPQIDPRNALENLFERALSQDLVSDGLIAQSGNQAAEFWSVREHIPEANRRVGAISSHDISVPLGAIPELIARGGEIIAKMGTFRINCFGHVGDGNLHYNVFPLQGETKKQHAHLRPDIKRALHDLTHELGGSVSAEHGIGRLKTGDLKRYGDPVKHGAMQAIKTALDPLGIMNPGAIFAE